MSKKILVTGGAGFIGSFLVDELIKQNHYVVILDNLEPQVHGEKQKLPSYLNPEADFIKGDVRDKEVLAKVLDDTEIVFHFAAAVGVGQSMYEIGKYIDINTGGTAQLWDYLVNKKNRIEKVIVAASMSSYGEGAYYCNHCGEVYPELRNPQMIKGGEWELRCPDCGEHITPSPTKETKPQKINSIYALTKKDQEEMSILLGKTYNIPTVGLRFFNVYGPRQSLSNPYTGVIAIFMSLLKNKKSPIIYEDGLQTRDFISVYDVVQASILAMEKDQANYRVFNVGSGIARTIKSVAEILASLYQVDTKPVVTNKFRKGDVRHCYANIDKIKDKLKFVPEIEFKKGLKELINWSQTVEAEDNFEKALGELKQKRLV